MLVVRERKMSRKMLKSKKFIKKIIAQLATVRLTTLPVVGGSDVMSVHSGGIKYVQMSVQNMMTLPGSGDAKAVCHTLVSPPFWHQLHPKNTSRC